MATVYETKLSQRNLENHNIETFRCLFGNFPGLFGCILLLSLYFGYTYFL